MAIKQAKPTRSKYDPQQDLRRFIDGVRMHPFVSTALEFGVGHFCRYGHPLQFDKRAFLVVEYVISTTRG